MRNYIKLLWTVILFLYLTISSSFSFAQEEVVETVCPNYTIELLGERVMVIDAPEEYTWAWSEVDRDDVEVTQRYSLYEQDTLSSETEVEIVSYTFSGAGTYRLVVEVIDEYDCTYRTEKNIKVVTSITTYIGPASDEISLGRESRGWSGTYLHEIIIEDAASLRSEQFIALIAEHIYYIDYADVLLLDGDSIGPFFDAVVALQQLVGLKLTNVDVYVFATINQSAFRRMISRYRDVIGIDQMYVVGKQYIGSLLTSLLLEKDMTQLNFVKTYTISLSSSNKWLVVSYIVDYLLYNNFPIATLIFILLVPLIVLLISIFRQVIGLSVFGVFNPLFFAFSLHIMGVIPTCIFFWAAFITTLLVRWFTKHIYLLYSAKIALLVIGYCLITLLLLRGVHLMDSDLIAFSMFQNTYVLFPFIFLIVIGNRVFSEQFYLFDKGRRIGLMEFFFVSLCVYRLLRDAWIQNIVLGYPELSLLSILIVVMVWRFTGLQLLEYIRFLPLIKNYFEEEE